MSGTMNELSKHMKELRRKRSLSQHSLAIELGITMQTVSRWERGLHSPQPEQLLKLRKLGLRV